MTDALALLVSIGGIVLGAAGCVVAIVACLGWRIAHLHARSVEGELDQINRRRRAKAGNPRAKVMATLAELRRNVAERVTG